MPPFRKILCADHLGADAAHEPQCGDRAGAGVDHIVDDQRAAPGQARDHRLQQGRMSETGRGAVGAVLRQL